MAALLFRRKTDEAGQQVNNCINTAWRMNGFSRPGLTSVTILRLYREASSPCMLVCSSLPSALHQRFLPSLPRTPSSAPQAIPAIPPISPAIDLFRDPLRSGGALDQRWQ